MSASGSVMVAVRVRPFNTREIEMGAKLCVQMNGPTTTLINPESGEDKKFSFDYSYWSHDGFDTNENGEMVAREGTNYATQRMVFDNLGRDVLNSAFEGYNSCLFAYGQTGSGKSYSMVGYGNNKGIIPIVCEEMFKSIEANTDPTIKYQVVVSMLEIYNECVKDLLNPKVNPPGGLKIRSKPGIGVYVDDLTPVPVASYAAIEAQMEAGTLNRTVASTKMNATSSRAHTVFTIIFTKHRSDMGLTSETQSRMNLVDLAGSERAESTGATGDRLKEGCAINASLSALGNVISALADISSGKAKKGAFVPYRNSALTRLLQDALGGNSRTIMICALSPADVNFDETLSTLRYADRAKQIKNKIFKMENPTDALIAKLKADNARLTAMLEGRIPPSLSDGAGEDPAATKQLGDLQQRLKEVEEEKIANEKLLREMQRSWEDKLRDAEAAAAAAAEAAAAGGTGGAVSLRTAKATTRPFMVNLHEDPQMTEKVVYVFNEGATRVGRADAAAPQDVVLSGLNIRAEHALVNYDSNTKALTVAVIDPETKLFINGTALRTPGVARPLAHGDRLLLGNNFVFRVEFPPPAADSDAPPVLVDPAFQGAGAWAAAMAEFQAAQGRGGAGAGGDGDGAEDAEVAKLRKQLEELQRERDESKGAAATAAAAGEIKEIQEALKWKRRSKKLKQDVDAMSPMIHEANSLADELGKELVFEVKIEVVRKGPLKANVCMRRPSNREVWVWDIETFESRLFLMRELFNRVLEHGPQTIPRELDPFWEPTQPTVLGQSFVYLKALAQLVEVDGTFRVVDARGLAQGELKAEIVPLGSRGEELPYLRSSSELLGMAVTFEVKTPFVTNVPATHVTDLQMSFQFQDKEFCFPAASVALAGAGATATFNYTQRLPVTVDQPFLTYLLTEAITFVVKGKPARSDELPTDMLRIALKRRAKINSAPTLTLAHSANAAAAAIASAAPVAAPAPVAVPVAVITAALSNAALSPSSSGSSSSAGAGAVPSAGLCSQCQETAATLWCTECARRLCATCFPVLHKAARRRDHSALPLDIAIESLSTASGAASGSASGGKAGGSVLCSKCGENAATVQCGECGPGTVYCDNCNGMMHKAPSRRDHARTLLQSQPQPQQQRQTANAGAGAMCGLCKDNPAVVTCAECEGAAYCETCNALRHKAPSRRDHVRAPIA